MADGIKITFNGLEKMKADLQKAKSDLQSKADKILNRGAQAIVTKAKQYAPVNLGALSSHISADVSKPLEKFVVVNSPYAAFMEFGTGIFASEYVGSLPDDWQSYAAQFKGLKGNGNFDDLILIIKQWIIDKGIDIFSRQELGTHIDIAGGVTGAKRKRRSRDEKEAQLDKVAYFMARKIVMKGIKAQPYLYPAYKEVLPGIIEEFKQLFAK